MDQIAASTSWLKGDACGTKNIPVYRHWENVARLFKCKASYIWISEPTQLPILLLQNVGEKNLIAVVLASLLVRQPI